MTQLNTKIQLYVSKVNSNIKVDFLRDVLLQDDSDGKGVYIKEWNLDMAEPTNAQLEALEAEAQVIENNEQIIYTRKKLYGSWESQLEEIFDKGLDSWKARITQIKINNPKETL
tara:strand:- start:99 stop:440 length:342 start_codon:yes stop_codon:yes gene_type:complete